MSVACETLLAKLIPLYLDTSCIKVVCGDASVSAALLKEQWDFIFFTGSTRVGKIVAQAAAVHLTPVLL
jgi:acyl-CoA reductase-like NAD-dependent aldehyde dehydrogenase